MFRRLRQRNEWKFFGVLPKADYRLAVAWWIALLLRGVLPAVFAIAMGVLVAAVQRQQCPALGRSRLDAALESVHVQEAVLSGVADLVVVSTAAALDSIAALGSMDFVLGDTDR